MKQREMSATVSPKARRSLGRTCHALYALSATLRSAAGSLSPSAFGPRLRTIFQSASDWKRLRPELIESSALVRLNRTTATRTATAPASVERSYSACSRGHSRPIPRRGMIHCLPIFLRSEVGAGSYQRPMNAASVAEGQRGAKDLAERLDRR